MKEFINDTVVQIKRDVSLEKIADQLQTDLRDKFPTYSAAAAYGFVLEDGTVGAFPGAPCYGKLADDMEYIKEGWDTDERYGHDHSDAKSQYKWYPGKAHYFVDWMQGGQSKEGTYRNYPNPHSKEVQLGWLDYVLNRSPFQRAFIRHDPEETLVKGHSFDTSYTLAYLISAGMVGRYCYKSEGSIPYEIVHRWNTFRNVVDEDYAFVLAHVFGIYGDKLNYSANIADDTIFETSYMSDIKTFLNKDFKYISLLPSTYDEQLGYFPLSKLWKPLDECEIKDDEDDYDDSDFFYNTIYDGNDYIKSVTKEMLDSRGRRLWDYKEVACDKKDIQKAFEQIRKVHLSDE